MLFRVICLIIYLVLTSTRVDALEICGNVKQGELILIKDDAQAKSVKLVSKGQNKQYKVDDSGIALVALHRDTPKKIELETISANNKKAYYEIKVATQKWDIQHIKGVQQNKVTPSSKDGAAIRREQKDVNKAVIYYEPIKSWQQGFIIPVEGKISGQFGNQRIFNGVARNPHSGTDIAATEGTSVKAAGNGKVVLSGKDYFYTGNMVIIDHGYGLQTIYAHLRDIKVKEGDMVQKGDIIGTVGKTGRATGAHLHWGASLNNVRFNPYSLLDINNKQCYKVTEKGKI